MRRAACVSLLILMGVLGTAGEARAVICTIDDVPGATLLLPYFEVQLNQPGVNTLFSINNASAMAVLAHVVIWSDLSVPVFDFNIYLTGYDVQTINLADILVTGVLPVTASAGQDPSDTISPQGQFSQDVNFASCQGQLPRGALPATFITHLQASLTGQFSALFGGCAGLFHSLSTDPAQCQVGTSGNPDPANCHSDNIARGYITVDTVNNCTLRFPGDAGYFAADGAGDVTNQNVLWGDQFHLNPATGQAEGATMVSLEASATNPETSVAGQYTFYGRYVNWSAVDNREPLATSFAARFINGGSGGVITNLIVWRDSKVMQGSFKCGTTPAWYPLGQESIVIFDEQEHPQVPATSPVSPQPPQVGIIPFPAEAQSTMVGGASFPVPFIFGWLYLNLNTAVTPAGSVPPEDQGAAQAWVGVRIAAQGGALYSMGYDAYKLDSACSANHINPGPLP